MAHAGTRGSRGGHRTRQGREGRGAGLPFISLAGHRRKVTAPREVCPSSLVITQIERAPCSLIPVPKAGVGGLPNTEGGEGL